MCWACEDLGGEQERMQRLYLDYVRRKRAELAQAEAGEAEVKPAATEPEPQTS